MFPLGDGPLLLPLLPTPDVLDLKFVRVRRANSRGPDTRPRLRRGRSPAPALNDPPHARRSTSPVERDVSLLGAVVLPVHLLVLSQILPSIRHAHVSGRAFEPRSRAGQGQSTTVPPGEEHGDPAMLTEPGGIAEPPVSQMRSQDHVKVIRVETRRLGLQIEPPEAQHPDEDAKRSSSRRDTDPDGRC